MEHDDEDHDGPLVPPTVEAHGPQGPNEDESPTIAVYDVQDFEPSMDDYEADYDADAVEEVEGNADDDNHTSSEKVTDSNDDSEMDSQSHSAQICLEMFQEIPWRLEIDAILCATFFQFEKFSIFFKSSRHANINISRNRCMKMSTGVVNLCVSKQKNTDSTKGF